jgi:hypothetical protein
MREKKDDAGIDYGMGMTNRDGDGIHYGVIHQGEVLQAWADSSEPYYGEPDENGEKEDFNEFAEPLSFYYQKEGYEAEQSQDDSDIFITKSPYYTLCAYCSPCAPGAGYVMSSRKHGIKAYCFGDDWFDSGKAPYPVYEVKTGQRVHP